MAYIFTYRSRRCTDFGVNLLSYAVGSPELRETEEDIDGRPGVIDYGTEWRKRTLTLRIDVTPDNDPFKKRQSAIYNWLKPTIGYSPLIFSDVPDRTYYAKITGSLGAEQFGRYGEFTLTFKCADPFAYGPERIIETVLTASPFVINAESDGMEATPPIYELTNISASPLADFTITNEYEVE